MLWMHVALFQGVSTIMSYEADYHLFIGSSPEATSPRQDSELLSMCLFPHLCLGEWILQQIIDTHQRDAT